MHDYLHLEMRKRSLAEIIYRYYYTRRRFSGHLFQRRFGRRSSSHCALPKIFCFSESFGHATHWYDDFLLLISFHAVCVRCG